MPFQPGLRHLKRRLRPYKTVPAVDEWLFEQGLRQILMLRAAGVAIEGATVLELGSGWHPVIPVLLRASGARRVVLTDLERLLDLPLLKSAFAAVHARRAAVAARLGLDPSGLKEDLARFEQDPDLFCALERLGLSYRVPFDPSELAADSLDVVVSRAVLEHVAPARLEDMAAAFHRALRPGGVMCHVIDNSDHWQHKDKSISRVNFLRYDDALWRWTSVNPQAYQNRLRHGDYLALFARRGFRILREESEIDEAALSELETMRLARRFHATPKIELAKITSYIVVQKPGARARGSAKDDRSGHETDG